MQYLYDRFTSVNGLNNMKGSRGSRTITRILKVRNIVHQELANLGYDQSKLASGKRALDVENVIYCIFSVDYSQKMYIGVTSKSSIVRFKQHLQSAFNNDNSLPLYKQMRKVGEKAFYVFPLQCFPDSTSFQENKLLFEKRWIERLHTYSPRGFNIQGAARRHHRRGRQRPLRYRKAERKVSNLNAHKRVFGYRNWDRRTSFLINCVNTNTLSERVQWESYKPYNLLMIRKQLLVIVHAHNELSNAANQVLVIINNFLKVRQRYVSCKKKIVGEQVQIFWGNKLLQHIPLRQIMNTGLNYLPEDDEVRNIFKNIQIVKKLTTPVGPQVLNFTKVARRFRDLKCKCHLFPKQFKNDKGHVLTGDLNIIENIKLRTILEYGPSYRLQQYTDPVLLIQDGLMNLVKRISPKVKLPENQFTPWINHISNQVQKRLVQLSQQSHDDVKKLPDCLTDLKKIFVFCLADKAKNNYVIVCRKHYYDVLRHEIDKQGTAYRHIHVSAENIISEQRNFLKPKSLWDENNKAFPYLYWMPKLHKSGARFIAGSSKCSTTKLSRLLSDCFLFILKVLRVKHDVELKQNGIRRFFLIESFQEVTKFISSFPCKVHCVASGDFSTMYTAIPHDDLKIIIKETLLEAWAEGAASLSLPVNDVFMEWTPSSISWTQAPRHKNVSHSNFKHCLSSTAFFDLFVFLLDNIYLQNGDIILRQVVGVPMGTNSSPPIANLYLYGYENKFISKLISQNRTPEARRLHYMFRFLDDTCCVNNPLWTQYTSYSYEDGGIYPRCLIYTATEKDKQHTTFMGIKLSVHKSGNVSTEVYDKTQDFPFVVRKYPYIHSLMPPAVLNAVFTGQLHRIYNICSNPKLFLTGVSKMTNDILHRGVSPKTLLRLFRTFLGKTGKLKWNKVSRSTLRHNFASFLKKQVLGIQHVEIVK